jgi:hypothetical protein
VRAFGALGWGAFSAPAGLIIGEWGYLAGFITSALVTLPCLPAAAAFELRRKEAEPAARPAGAGPAPEERAPGERGAAGPAAAGGRKERGAAAAGLMLEAKVPEEDAVAAAEDAIAAGPAPLAVRLAIEAGAEAAACCMGAAGGVTAAAAAIDLPSDEEAACAKSEAAAVIDLPAEEAARTKSEAAAALRLAPLSFSARLRLLLRSLDVWLFLWQALLQGYGLGLYQSYLFIALGGMGASTALMGLTITVDCLAEFPAFWFKEQVGPSAGARAGRAAWQRNCCLHARTGACVAAAAAPPPRARPPADPTRASIRAPPIRPALPRPPPPAPAPLQPQVLRYLSVDTLLNVSVAGYALRLGLYALLPLGPSPWLVLPIQLLHGLTYAWGWGAGTIKAKRLAPPGLQATMQVGGRAGTSALARPAGTRG